jgi:hypothetical protein
VQNTRQRDRVISAGSFISLAVTTVMLAGCKGVPAQGEQQARQDLKAVSGVYRPQTQRPALPTLQSNTGLSNFLTFAILNQPQVEAAYFNWASSVERITVERSLPDPRLTFQSDIANVVMSLIPGLMMDFPGPGKRLREKYHATIQHLQATTPQKRIVTKNNV